jgi:copper(I)-binding protein
MTLSRSEPPVADRVISRVPTTGRKWRSVVVLFVGAVLSETLAGCYASQNAETAREAPDTPGVDGGVGSMVLDDVYLETADTVPAAGSVALRAALTDDSSQPDRLVAVTTPAAAAVELLNADGTPATAGIDVPGNGQVDATTGPVLLRLTGLKRALTSQAIVSITFEFARAGRVTLDDVPAGTPAQGDQ